MAGMWFLFALLAALLWASSDIASSMLVHHYERDPFILAWILSVLDLCVLIVVPLMISVATPWSPWLFLGGVSGFFSFLAFLIMVRHLDISVTNAAWALMAIIISAVGLLVFHERWSLVQTIGAVTVLGGVFFLSFHHLHRSLLRTLILLLVPAVLWAPFFLVQDAALRDGTPLLVALFWPLLGSRLPGILLPVFRRGMLQAISVRFRRGQGEFLVLNVVAFAMGTLGFLSVTAAYALGPASLVVISTNIQPFFTLSLAWFATKLFPLRAPRELLTAQSVGIKVMSFVVVFAGLGMLAL